jgi:transcriptional regulator with XRE-family HTH domain
MATRPLAELLRELRETRGTSLRAAARELGVDPSYLSRIERGKKPPSDSVLDRAANYYDIPRASFPSANGDLPADIVAILTEHPELVIKLRRDYG